MLIKQDEVTAVLLNWLAVHKRAYMQIHRSRTASFTYDLAIAHTLSHSLSSLYTCNSHEICCFSTHQPIRFVYLVTQVLLLA